MTKRKKLGEMLMAEGLIDEIQLNSAIGHQRNWGGKLGSTLVELGFLTEEDISRVLEGQLKQKCLGDDDLVPTPQALECVSAQDAFRYNIMPLRVDERTLELAMSNPYDLELTDEIGFKLKKRVKGILAVESAIKRAIKRYYFGEEAGKHYKTAVSSGASEKMEIIHDERDMVEKQAAQANETYRPAPPVNTPKPAPAPDAANDRVDPSAEVISKAVAYLLIEKGIIKRDELIDKMKQIHEKSGG